MVTRYVTPGPDGRSLPLISAGDVAAAAVGGGEGEEAKREGVRIWGHVEITTELIPTVMGNTSEEICKREYSGCGGRREGDMRLEGPHLSVPCSSEIFLPLLYFFI